MRGVDRRFPALCAELFRLAQAPLEGSGPARGWRWEERIADALTTRGFPAKSVAGGVRVHGTLPASRLRHQVDGEITCTDALVIGEWKAYYGPVPKNEMLRFKAVTDDLYDEMACRREPRRPVLRLFGVAGDGSPELRWYAARHGIALVEQSRWPAPVLSDPRLIWPAGTGPTEIDRQRLAWLSRPLQDVYPRTDGGELMWPKRLPNAAVTSLLQMHDRWSQRLFAVIAQHRTVTGEEQVAA
ncbi:MAG: hypothetical protein WKF96_05935 [Solirubrobacteraceae bacterium]